MNASAASFEFPPRVRAFGAIHAGRESEAFARNLHTQVELLASDGREWPVSINEDEAGNAWVCSPRTAYGDYAAEEAARYMPGWLGRPLSALLRGFARWLGAAQVDRAVALNNWLLSTNLYPELRESELDSLLGAARTRWPGHALWFRSLNRVQHADWIAALAARGFCLLASRQVYLYEDIERLARHHGDLRRDFRELRRTPLQRVGGEAIGEADYARIAELYELLYVGKYSACNPRYSARFIAEWHRAGLLELHGFRDAAGVLVAAIGLFRQGSTLSAPIVGYDTALPQKLALYRLLCACACEVAQREGLLLNFSAGAAQFKRLRGGRAAIEYSAVDARGQPWRTRATIALLSFLSCRVVAPMMVRYKL